MRQITREAAGAAVMFRLEGAFEALTAEALRIEIEQLSAGEVVIDFSRVRQFQDRAVPGLVRGLSSRPVRLVGLSHHHERLLRYCGFGAAAPSSSWSAPEDPNDIAGPIAQA